MTEIDTPETETPIDDGPKVQTPFPLIRGKDALAATRFLEWLEENELPVPTEAQLDRAKRLIASNPIMRQHDTPLGVLMLARSIPLSKRERRDKSFKPSRHRTGGPDEIEASPEAVAAFVEANPHMTGQEAATAIANGHGYQSSIGHLVSRVRRFGEAFKPGGRFPTHIREKMLCLSAMAQAIKLCETRDIAAAVEA